MKPKTPLLASPVEFAGTVAVVTGGTAGLGQHLVQALIELGAEVCFCGSREAPGRALEEALGPRGHFFCCDLANVAQTRRFVARAGALRGRLDYLVNNAAIDPRIELARATVEDFDRLVAVNLRAGFVVSQAALPFLIKGNGKAIVNVCTTNYMLGLSPFTVYNASKSGIVGFTRSLARELGSLGIRANMISPGWIMTAKQLREHVTPADRKELLQAQALKFLLTEEQVTPATLFLLSRAAGGITGQNLVVDGGKVMY